jgi:ribosomal protein S25
MNELGISDELLAQIKHDYALNRRLSAPYLQRKWKLSAETAMKVVRHLTAGWKR